MLINHFFFFTKYNFCYSFTYTYIYSYHVPIFHFHTKTELGKAKESWRGDRRCEKGKERVKNKVREKRKVSERKGDGMKIKEGQADSLVHLTLFLYPCYTLKWVKLYLCMTHTLHTKAGIHYSINVQIF